MTTVKREYLAKCCKRCNNLNPVDVEECAACGFQQLWIVDLDPTGEIKDIHYDDPVGYAEL